MSRRTGWRLFWGGLLLGAGAAKLYAVLDTGQADDTLSEWLRWALHTDSTVGRVVFGVGWTAFSGWFLWHILRTKGEE